MKKMTLIVASLIVTFVLGGCASTAGATKSTEPTAPAAAKAAPAAILEESFDNVDNSVFWTGAYKSLPGQADAAFYTITSGSCTVADGTMTIGNSRFVVGTNDTTPSSAASAPNGVLDLSVPTKLTITFSAQGTGEKNFQVYVDNNTSKMAESPLGGGSRVLQVLASTTGPKSPVVVELPAGRNNAFLQIRCESGAMVFIDSIKLTR
jgi:hypothetical protein